MTATMPMYAWRVTADYRRCRPVSLHAVGRGGNAFCGQPAPSGWREPSGEIQRCARCELVVDSDHITPTAIVDCTGISYRQLDHWTRAGYLVPDVPARGCGSQRVFSRAEFGVARRMARLIQAGISPAAAVRVARGGPLGPGISIRFDDEEGTP